MVHCFLDFALNPADGELRRGGKPVAIQPLVFELLVYLVRRRGELVRKEELLRDVWGGVFSEGVITTAMGLLRKTLGEDGKRSTIIQTVRARGYRFVATVTPAPTLAPPFFGRQRELDVFQQKLSLAAPFLLWIQGIGGIGKSALLRAFAARCESIGRAHRLLSAAQLGLGPSAVERAFRALAREAGPSAVLLIDHYEQLGELDEWFRTVLLPKVQLGGIVLAVQRAPSSIVFGPNETAMELKGLAQQEATQLLAHLCPALSPEQARDASADWDGHPLALGMIASMGGLATSEPLYRLSERFLVQAPSDAFRRGLEAAALIPGIDVGLLHRLSETPDIMGLLAWLSSISFVRVAYGRVEMHQVSAAALVARLAREHPARLDALALAAFDAICSEPDAGWTASERSVRSRQIFSIGKHHPVLRPLYHHRADELHVELASTEAQRDAFLALLAELQGEHAASSVGPWLTREHELWCVQDAQGALEGAVLVLYLSPADLELGFDPLLADIRAATAQRKLAPGWAMVHRALLDRGRVAGAPAMQRCMEILHAHHQVLPTQLCPLPRRRPSTPAVITTGELGRLRRTGAGLARGGAMPSEPTQLITDSFVVLPDFEPWLTIAQTVSDFRDHFVHEPKGGRAVPVAFRDMRRGSAEWLSSLARNLSVVPQ